MDRVFEKTRELGQALLECGVYQNMKAAEDRAMRNELAATLMGQYIDKRQKLQALMMRDGADPVEMKETSREMDDLQAQLQTLDEVSALNIARNEFNNLIEQVNQVLQFIVTGRISTDDAGCTGSCESCGGRCH